MAELALLALAGFVVWIVSTVGGGGGATLLLPLVAFVAGAQAVAPVTTLATLVAGSGRAFVFWRSIEWRIVLWALPGALIGAVLGAIVFANTSAEWLQIVVGLFLVSTVLQYRFGERPRTFEVRNWMFLPAEFAVGFFSGLVGAMGPVMNTVYLNAGITKERMVGTKTAVSLPMHVVQVATYTVLGAMTGRFLLLGLAAGSGALVSNWLGKRLLRYMPEKLFRRIVVGFMALSGLLMIWDQREALLNLLGR